MQKIKEFLESFKIAEEMLNSNKYKIHTDYTTNFYIDKKIHDYSTEWHVIDKYILISYQNNKYFIYKFIKGNYKVFSKHNTEEEIINTLIYIL